MTQKLLTKAIANKLPTLDETVEWPAEKLVVHWKLFNPSGAGTWYIYAYDPDTEEAIAFVNLGDALMAERGYVSITKLKEIKVPPFGLRIERDQYFKSTPLLEIEEKVKNGTHI